MVHRRAWRALRSWRAKRLRGCRSPVLVWLSILIACSTLFCPAMPVVAAPLPPCPGGPGDLCRKIHLTGLTRPHVSAGCPITSTAVYSTIPRAGAPTDRPAARHADLNLAMRGYVPVAVPLVLVQYNGDTDARAPQAPGIFAGRRPTLISAYQVYDWDWGCGPDGCRGPLLSGFPTTLLGLATTPGERLAIPSRPASAEIYGGGYMALVLYAEPGRITLKYTREDNVISGYTVHLEKLCVDPNLLALYNNLNAGGRGSLPALHNGDALGTAAGTEMDLAIRDNGTFMDPRSQKDWWR